MANRFQKQEYSMWITVIGRFGFIAKGIIYISVGFLALQISIGIGEGDMYNAKQILDEIVYESFGIIAIVFCMISLLAHAAYRILRGAIDLENKGRSFTGVLFRAKNIIVGLAYAGLSYAAFQILMGWDTTSAGERSDLWITKIMDWPFGKFIILAFALFAVIVGCYNFYICFRDKVEHDFDYSAMSSMQRKWFSSFGRIGKAAWGIVSFMVAFLLYQAATSDTTEQAVGLGKVLEALANQSYGYWVLGITASGLLIYGLYQLTLSYYRRIKA